VGTASVNNAKFSAIQVVPGSSHQHLHLYPQLHRPDTNADSYSFSYGYRDACLATVPDFFA